MNNKCVLITGSDGLVGSESAYYFSNLGYKIIGIDNNSRAKFFGNDASVLWNRKQIKKDLSEFEHFHRDITAISNIENIFSKYSKNIELIIHAAAQPSHDWAAINPQLDFRVNALGTLNMLEMTKKYCKETPFIFLSTNKVYGDNPNKLRFSELSQRYEVNRKSKYFDGIDENMSIDSTLHSLFGVSKTSADLLVQEYGKYFGMNTVSFRGGCLTGSKHSGTKLHGFISYLIKCIATDSEYTIFGYKGKQVRDNIHSKDLVKAFHEFMKKPKKGEVYNIGGGRESNCSVLEAIELGENILNKSLKYNISELNRIGDHQWYISNLDKFKLDYPNWKINYSIKETIEDICLENFDRWSYESNSRN
tara:strand:- start:834 stop:1922 length:1089 start_codon:yes stop_codon:yes gene_type:complete